MFKPEELKRIGIGWIIVPSSKCRSCNRALCSLIVFIQLQVLIEKKTCQLVHTMNNKAPLTRQLVHIHYRWELIMVDMEKLCRGTVLFMWGSHWASWFSSGGHIPSPNSVDIAVAARRDWGSMGQLGDESGLRGLLKRQKRRNPLLWPSASLLIFFPHHVAAW